MKDKNKPKFKDGDWVIDDDESVFHITIDNNMYQLETLEGKSCHFSYEIIEREFRLWTIQDAKDGDILVCNEEILLFKSYSVQNRISLYCWYNGQTNNFHRKEVDNVSVTTRNKICPATKEQRDALEKAMTDAGYTFDFEKKELKEIEPDEWSEECCINQLIVFCENCMVQDTNAKRCVNFLKSLKGRVSLQPKQEWSEEDENRINRLIAYFEDKESFAAEDDVVYANWLKSLKDRITWKPSDE